MLSLQEQILQTCFKRFDGYFASGARANNKLDLDLISTLPTLRGRVAKAVTGIVVRYNPDMIVAVPNGANWLAIDVALELGTAALLLNKDEHTKTFSCHATDVEACEAAERIVVVEDAFTAFTSVRKVLSLPGISQRAVGVVGIWDRGDPTDREQLALPAESLVKVHIPPMLPDHSPLWEFAK